MMPLLQSSHSRGVPEQPPPKESGKQLPMVFPGLLGPIYLTVQPLSPSLPESHLYSQLLVLISKYKGNVNFHKLTSRKTYLENKTPLGCNLDIHLVFQNTHYRANSFQIVLHLWVVQRRWQCSLHLSRTGSHSLWRRRWQPKLRKWSHFSCWLVFLTWTFKTEPSYHDHHVLYSFQAHYFEGKKAWKEGERCL